MRFFIPAIVVIILLPPNRLRAQAPPETVKEQFAKRAARLWSLQPVTKPAVPAGVTTFSMTDTISMRSMATPGACS